MAYEPLEYWDAAHDDLSEADSCSAEPALNAKDHSWGRLAPSKAATLAGALLAAVVLAVVASGINAGPRGPEPGQPSLRVRGVVGRFDAMHAGIEAYKTVLGGDPFEFQCPLPGVGKAMQTLNKSAGTRPSCCKAYEKLGWPFQFPECAKDVHCFSCWVTSQNLVEHPAAPLAGVAWAASLLAYQGADKKHGWLASKLESKLSGVFGSAFSGGPKIGETELEDGQIVGTLHNGLDDLLPNLCPNTNDWEQVMLHDDQNNLHARVLKSEGRKLAVVVFRGTQMTSYKNWHVDADTHRVGMQLGAGGPTTQVHQGFLESLQRVLPRVRMWVEGSVLSVGAIPDDWTLLFTGHSLGGALAVLAATLAEVEGWRRRPDAVVVYGAPRVADGVLSAWWRERGLCKRLLRVNTYNDVVHWMPLKTAAKWWENMAAMMACAADLDTCMSEGSSDLMGGGDGTTFSDLWEHVCGDESEALVESSLKGVNQELSEFSLVGGGLAHMIDNCKYGYSFGLLKSSLALADPICGVSPTLCQPPAV